jgi:hypothetical protein
MDIKRIGSTPSAQGPAEYFTGTVRIDHLLQPPDPARVAGEALARRDCALEFAVQVIATLRAQVDAQRMLASCRFRSRCFGELAVQAFGSRVGSFEARLSELSAFVTARTELRKTSIDTPNP